ncbi:hypothetical protein D3C80_1550460 [compost metagenome]
MNCHLIQTTPPHGDAAARRPFSPIVRTLIQHICCFLQGRVVTRRRAMSCLRRCAIPVRSSASILRPKWRQWLSNIAARNFDAMSWYSIRPIRSWVSTFLTGLRPRPGRRKTLSASHICCFQKACASKAPQAPFSRTRHIIC